MILFHILLDINNAWYKKSSIKYKNIEIKYSILCFYKMNESVKKTKMDNEEHGTLRFEYYN